MDRTTERKELGMDKAKWIEGLCAKKRAMGYTETEVAAYRTQLHAKYDVTRAQFRAALKELGR